MTQYKDPGVSVYRQTKPGVLLEFFDENDDVTQFSLNPAKAKRVAYKILAALAEDEECRRPRV